MRRWALAAVLLLGALGCDDMVLDGPDRPKPPRRCPPGLELDPDRARCVPQRCVDDDGCDADRRCDLILGECVPCDEGDCFAG